MAERFFNCSACDADEFCTNISQLTELTKFDMDVIMADPRFNSCTDLHVQTRGLAVGICVPYAVIFLLSVVGNSLVVMTLVRHRQMRTITNMFLLNLALSDLLLAVFCMPFTLVPLLLQDFVFGEVMCVLIRYLQVIWLEQYAVCSAGSVTVRLVTRAVCSVFGRFRDCETRDKRSMPCVRPIP
ncbi:gastrin/cholecystokinin type B receptor-like [Gigantopelta aegis]|uniref:gastrin/cholecystokinin type B receptor-like n=1 Tax=Gigantopelta aegis TaxID=1735272 RepID=UPI001B88B7E5|nr:gastrin/cholecystokinin type B receptor-like [Gigantopelta aegis]